MSTYYYAICTDHQAVSEILVRQPFLGDWQAWSSNLLAFVEEHGSCKSLIVTEHDDRVFDYKQQPPGKGD